MNASRRAARLNASAVVAAVRRAATLAAVALLASACAGTPARESPAGAQAVGGLSLEFPEGFLGQPPRTIHSRIRLHVRDLGTGERFRHAVTEGSFSFAAAAGQELLLARYTYSQRASAVSYYLNDEIGIRFRLEPGQLLHRLRRAARAGGPTSSLADPADALALRARSIARNAGLASREAR